MRRTLLAAALTLAPALLRGATPCNDCCQMPCVEAEIRLATKMQAWYRTQLNVKQTKEAYEAAEAAKAAELSLERQRDTGGLAACKWTLPDPRKDTVTYMQWRNAGWSIVEAKDGALTYNFSLKMDPKACTLNEKKVALYKDVVPCLGIAEAAEKHERAHVDACKPGRERTPAEAAKDEVAAYDVELKELNALRDAIGQICSKKGTCKDKDTKEVRIRLEQELDELKKQVAKRGGK